MLFAAPPPVDGPVWLQRPTPAALERAHAGSRRATQAEAVAMTCYVLADGRLANCAGEPALRALADAYRLDRSTYPQSKVVVQESLPKLYDHEPVQVSAPTPAELSAAGGDDPVAFLCRISVSGRAEDCAPTGEHAPSQKSLLAAQPLLGRFTFTPAQLGGAPVPAYQVVYVALGVQIIANPDWVRRPNGEDLAHLFPEKALRKGADGETRIRCVVTDTGTLTRCELLHEAPAGLGFGMAALATAPLFQMHPQTVDGRPVGGATVTVPMTWRAGEPDSEITTVTMRPWLPFVAAPDGAAVRQAFARGPAGQGSVTANFLCRLRGAGDLGGCETEGQSVSGAEENAARSLLRMFKVDPAVMQVKGARDWLVRVAVADSPRMRSGETRYLHQIDWVKQLSEEGGQVFPDKAAAAGVLKGNAVVDCIIDSGGRLQNCAMSKEAPEGYGFGETALRMAAAMQANLWTRDGEPAVGAHVSFPLTFIYRAEPAVAAPPAQADAKP